MGMFDKKGMDVARVKFLGVRQGKQTKIFSTVNFPVYSFLIEYKDGGREIKEYSADTKKDMTELNKILMFIDM